jgi:hypothetical protein
LPLTPFNTFGLRCAALGPGQAEAAYHRCGSARPGGYVKKELVDRAGAGSLAFPRLQICEGVMPGKTRKRGGGGRATGGPGAASSRWRGSWPADAPSLKRALGGPSGRIFLNAAREIAGILEELV